MNINTFFYRAVLLVTLMLLPQLSQAYGVTDRSVTKLRDGLNMYSLTYEFGFLNADLWMPIGATGKTSSDAVGYAGARGMSQAIVLSKAAINGSMYYVPKGERASFTLVILDSFSEPTTRDIKHIQITALPHIIEVTGKKKVKRLLSETELAAFTVSEAEEQNK